MREGWQNQKLGEVAEFIGRGISPKYIDEGGVCVLNQKCIRGHKINYEFSRRHNDILKPIKSDRYIAVGDVLINSTGTGTLGRVAQVLELPEEAATVDSHVTIVRPVKGKFYPDYFGYLLIGIEDKLKEAGEGASGQTELARSVIAEGFNVSFPSSIEVQRIIAKKLDIAFAEIENAVAAAEVGLVNARVLFQAYINEVFDASNNSWVETTLGEYYDVRDGTHDSPKYIESGFPLVTSKNLRSGKLDFTNVQYVSEEDYNQISQRSGVKPGDVLMAMIGTIGNPIVIESELKFAIKNVALFKTEANQSPQFLRYFLMSSNVINQMARDAKGATQKFVGLGYLRKFKIKVPKFETQTEIAKKILAMEELTNSLEVAFNKKLSMYANLKNSILIHAFNGELTKA